MHLPFTMSSAHSLKFSTISCLKCVDQFDVQILYNREESKCLFNASLVQRCQRVPSASIVIHFPEVA